MTTPGPYNASKGSQRLFVACDLPDAAQAAVADWQSSQLGPVAGVRAAGSVHLTLCFLGSTPQHQVPAITDALDRLRFMPARVAFGAPVFLPERGGKRVIALSLEPAGSDPDALRRLGALQRETSAALAGLGVYTPDKRAWLPHVTVGRFRRPGQPLALQNVNLQEFCVSQMVLYASVLTRGGAMHSPLAVFSAQ